MLFPALLILALAFVALTFVRLGGAHRALLKARWPALLFAGAAGLFLLRGAIAPALLMAGLGALSWVLWPRLSAPVSAKRDADSPADQAARALLGVGKDAGETEIRRAYRAKMAQAHPDRGGSDAAAARLTAARDRLLRRGR